LMIFYGADVPKKGVLCRRLRTGTHFRSVYLRLRLDICSKL